MTLKYNEDESNPGFLGELSKEDAALIAKKLNLTLDNSDSASPDFPAYTNVDVSILVETNYGVSFELHLKSSIEAALKDISLV